MKTSFTLKELIEAKPCRSEFTRLVNRLVDPSYVDVLSITALNKMHERLARLHDRLDHQFELHDLLEPSRPVQSLLNVSWAVYHLDLEESDDIVAELLVPIATKLGMRITETDHQFSIVMPQQQKP